MKQAHTDVLKQGTIGGFLGYLAIVLYYAGFNVVNGRSPFHTVAALGDALFDTQGVLPMAGAVIAYNGLNLLFFLLLGIVAASMIYEVELHPGVWLAGLFTLIAAFLFTSGVMAMVAGTWADVSVPVVLLGNLFAAAALGGYLAWRHPGLARRIERSDDDDAEDAAENPGPPAARPVGPVSPRFDLDQATPQREVAVMSVREIMQDGVVGIRPEANLHDLARLLAQEQISGVPVVGAGNELLGVVSATDLILCAAIHGQPDAALHWDQFQVEDIMTPVVMTVTPNTPVPELACAMTDSHIHRALVTENGKLLGIVTTFDIMRAAAEPAVREQRQTEPRPAEPQSNLEMEPAFG